MCPSALASTSARPAALQFPLPATVDCGSGLAKKGPGSAAQVQVGLLNNVAWASCPCVARPSWPCKSFVSRTKMALGPAGRQAHGQDLPAGRQVPVPPETALFNSPTVPGFPEARVVHGQTSCPTKCRKPPLRVPNRAQPDKTRHFAGRSIARHRPSRGGTSHIIPYITILYPQPAISNACRRPVERSQSVLLAFHWRAPRSGRLTSHFLLTPHRVYPQPAGAYSHNPFHTQPLRHPALSPSSRTPIGSPGEPPPPKAAAPPRRPGRTPSTVHLSLVFTRRYSPPPPLPPRIRPDKPHQTTAAPCFPKHG